MTAPGKHKPNHESAEMGSVLTGRGGGGRRERVGIRNLPEPEFHTSDCISVSWPRVDARLSEMQQSSRGAVERTPGCHGHRGACTGAAWPWLPTSLRGGVLRALSPGLGFPVSSSPSSQPLPTSSAPLPPITSSICSSALLQASSAFCQLSLATFSSKSSWPKPQAPPLHFPGPLRLLSRETAGVTPPPCPALSVSSV